MYVVVFLILLFSVYLSACPDQNSHVPNISACARCSVTFTFNVTGLKNCEEYYYKVVVYQDHGQNYFEPIQNPYHQFNNTGTCNVNLTIMMEDTLSFNNSLFQVVMILPPHTDVYCSNYFSILVQGPPDPVNITSTLNCTGVLLTWLPPPSLPGCPILYYTITILELNITNITTSTSIYYLLSDIIISNEIYRVTISATNGASTGNKTMYCFNTSLVPQVILTHYHIEVDPDNPHNGVLIFRTQVIDVDCTPSYPTHLFVNITCGDYCNYSDYNITVTNNGSITINEGVHLVCPLDQFNCSAHFIWSNLNLSNITLIKKFNTSQIQTVDITPVTNGIRYQCNFLPHSTLWGCGIMVTNSTNNVTSPATHQNTKLHIAGDTLSNLYPGKYNVTIFNSYNETSIDYSHIIMKTTVTVIGASSIMSPLLSSICPSSSSTADINPNSSGKYIIIVVVLIAVVIITVIAIIVFVIIAVKAGDCRRYGGFTPQNNGDDNKKISDDTINETSFTDTLTSPQTEMETSEIPSELIGLRSRQDQTPNAQPPIPQPVVMDLIEEMETKDMSNSRASMTNYETKSEQGPNIEKTGGLNMMSSSVTVTSSIEEDDPKIVVARDPMLFKPKTENELSYEQEAFQPEMTNNETSQWSEQMRNTTHFESGNDIVIQQDLDNTKSTNTYTDDPSKPLL